MPESRQLRIVELETEKARCRKSLDGLRLVMAFPHALPVKDKISNLIRERETELRKVEDELHELYVQRIREELGNFRQSSGPGQ